MNCTIILALTLIAAPASARSLNERIHDLPPSEYAFQALNITEKALTIDCLNRAICHETNPLYGRNPSTGVMIGAMAGEGLLHAAITSVLQDHAPGAVKPWEAVSIGIAATAVGINVRVELRGRR